MSLTQEDPGGAAALGLRRRPQLAQRLSSAPPLVAFAVVFIATTIAALAVGAHPFYYDSGLYWTLGGSFAVHGHFSLLNFNSSLRGYLWPLMARLLHVLAVGLGSSDSLVARLANTLAISLVGAILAPRLAELAWPRRRWGFWRRLALVALLLVFWSGYLPYPLTDLPALMMVLLALVSLAHPESPGWSVLAGAACGAAIDMRPSYILLAPMLLALTGLVWWEHRGDSKVSLRRKCVCAALLIGAFALVSLPQSLASQRHFSTWSFVPGAAAHLATVQLTEGLRLQRYETYVGPGHSPRMLYLDAAGDRLLSEQKHDEISSTSQYVGLIINHPSTMLSLFVRHTINGFDQRYNTPYVARLDTRSHWWLRLGSLTLVFLALLRVLWPAAQRRLAPTRWRYPLALLLCSLTAVPSAVETRYLLSVYVLVYMLVLLPGWSIPLPSSLTGIASPLTTAGVAPARHMSALRSLALIAVAYACFLAVALHVASAASSSLRFE
ncbi:MAG TPA: hypothetical protein VGI76_01750 [Solirubrobacteraceae bacterium]|jgi:hypothetical protein